MLAWFGENLATIVVGALLLAAVAAVILSMIRNKKRGKSSCGCGCSGCPMSDTCHHK